MARLEIHKDFITKEEQNSLIDWIDEKLSKGEIPFGENYDSIRGGYVIEKNRRTTRFAKNIVYPKVAYDIQSRIIDSYNWGDKMKPQKLNDVVGMLAVVHYKDSITVKHNDPKTDGNLFEHVRCNILLKKPEKGGIIHLEQRQILLEERDLHCYEATSHTHFVTKVEGNTPRYLWIFSFSVPNLHWDRRVITRKH